MKAFAAVAVLCAVRAGAGPAGSLQSAPATGYSGAYLGSVSLSLAADPFYGSRLLDSFELHLRSVAAMTVPRAVTDYLEVAVIGATTAGAVKASLGTEPIEPPRAAALLLAHALARPEQFREVLEGLESRKAGLGKHTAQLLREARGTGNKRLIAALRDRGALKPKGATLTYGRFGQLDRLFDGGGAEAPDAFVPVSAPAAFTGYGSDGRPRRSGLKPARD